MINRLRSNSVRQNLTSELTVINLVQPFCFKKITFLYIKHESCSRIASSQIDEFLVLTNWLDGRNELFTMIDDHRKSLLNILFSQCSDSSKIFPSSLIAFHFPREGECIRSLDARSLITKMTFITWLEIGRRRLRNRRCSTPHAGANQSNHQW